MTDVTSTPSAVADTASATHPAPLARRSLAWLAILFALGLTLALAAQLTSLAPDDEALTPALLQQILNGHALLLVFFCALPALTHVFGQLALPAAVGREDHAYPSLGQWGFRLYVIAGAAVVLAITLGAVPAQWSLVGASALENGTVGAVLAIGLHLMSLSMIAVALNHLATIFGGEREDDAPVSLVAWVFGVVALGVLAVAPAMASWSILFLVEGTGTELFGLGADHTWSTFARLFGYVEFGAGMLVLVLGIGLGMHFLTAAAARRLDTGSRVGPALAALLLLGLFAGAYPLGQGASTAVVGSALRLAMAIPAAVLLHALWSVARAGMARIDAAVLHSLAFVLHVTVVAASGLALASLATGPVLIGTKFAAAHQHLLFAGGGLAIFFAACHHWWAMLFGEALDEAAGVWGATLLLAGTQLTFLPGLILGAQGVLVGEFVLPAPLQDLAGLTAFGAVILAVGVLIEGWAMLKALLKRQERGTA